MRISHDARYPYGYSGWVNRETWHVYIWLTNDADRYLQARKAAQKGAEALREWVEEREVPDESGLAADLVRQALAWVDWEGLRKALVE